MKLLIIVKLSIVSMLSIFFLSAPALAVDVTGTACKDISDSAVCADAASAKTKNPIFGSEGALTKVISTLSVVLAIIAVIVLIVAGIRYALSGGDPSKTAQVRNTIIYAVVGLIVAVIAQALVNLVLKNL